MTTNRMNTIVRMTVLGVVATVTLVGSVGCRETALLAASGARSQSTGWTSSEYIAGLGAQGYASDGAPLSSSDSGLALGADGPTATVGCNRTAGTYTPACQTAPATPSWVGTSMGW